MSAIHVETVPKNWLERFTSSTVFAVLFTLSVLLVAPLLLLGLVLLAVLIAGADSGAAPLLGWVGGGVAGLIGLFRGRARAWPISSASVEATIVCLVAGIIAALCVLGAAVVIYEHDARSVDRWSLALWALVAVPHAVLIVAGVASLERLPRRYLRVTGERFDSVPVIFLLVALGLAGAAALAT